MMRLSKDKKWWGAFLLTITILAIAIDVGSTGLDVAACVMLVALIFAAINIWAT